MALPSGSCQVRNFRLDSGNGLVSFLLAVAPYRRESFQMNLSSGQLPLYPALRKRDSLGLSGSNIGYACTATNTILEMLDRQSNAREFWQGVISLTFLRRQSQAILCVSTRNFLFLHLPYLLGV